MPPVQPGAAIIGQLATHVSVERGFGVEALARSVARAWAMRPGVRCSADHMGVRLMGELAEA
jgi:hypothetical protein